MYTTTLGYIPIIKSVKNNAISGIANAKDFLLKYAPPNKAIAAIGAKFGGWEVILQMQLQKPLM